MRRQTKLTKRSVEAAPVPPKGEQTELWDTELGGLHLRVSPSGRRVYRFKYRSAGRQVIATLGQHGPLTAELARERALVLAAAVADGRDPVAEQEAADRASEEARRRRITVSDLIDAYLEQGPALNPAKRPRSWEHDKSTLNAHVRPLLGRLTIQDARRADVEKMIADVIAGRTRRIEKLGPHAKRVVRGGPAAARAAAVATQTLFAWAERREMVTHNPAKGVQKPPAGKRERYLTVKEISRLFHTIDEMEAAGSLHPTFADELRLLTLTGSRRKEIEHLRWAEIDFQRGVAFLPAPRSKNGAKTVPLAGRALALLNNRPRTAEFVFPSLVNARPPTKGANGKQPSVNQKGDRAPSGPDARPANALAKNWQRVRKAAGLPDDIRLHDLRHTMASLLVARGASLPMVGKVLGHRNAQTTSRYAHLMADPLRTLVDDATAAFAPRRKIARRTKGRR